MTLRTAARARLALVALVLAGTAGPALAHHGMDGRLPATLAEGFISGLAHPVIGLDHLAFVIAVGLVGAAAGAVIAVPAAFVASTLAGATLHLAGLAIPFAEVGIASSVVAIGLVAMRSPSANPSVVAGLVALAGVFHGFAYAESIFGAEPTPLAAYLAGFCTVQLAIAAGVAFIVRAAASAHGAGALTPRFAGAMIAGVGVAMLAEKMKTLALQGIA